MLPIWNCFGCTKLTSSPQQLFCERCQRELRQTLHSRNENIESKRGLRILTIGRYQGIWAKWIKNLKRRSRGFVLSEERDFISSLVEYYCEDSFFSQVEALVPLPSHHTRTIWQTDLGALLAIEISKQMKIPLCRSLRISKKWMISRHKAQKDRALVSDRWSVLNESKYKIQNKASYKTAILVDDVTTSGATLVLAQRMLESQGITVRGAIVLASV